MSHINNKIRVGILFGGRSAEHEVSLQSAKNVVDALDKSLYEVVLIGIDKEGQWHINDESGFLLNADNPKLISLNHSNKEVGFIPGRKKNQLTPIDQNKSINNIDVIFPILHGPLGEDGAVQGMLRLANLPFVGSSVLGSAICMDKDVAKRLLQQAGLPVCRYVVYKKNNGKEIKFDEISKKLGTPLFVKPANMGSSVGISKVSDAQQLQQAVALAFEFDQKILIEECIKGRELEVAVIGNEQPITSVVGEIIPQQDFYSYEAKYIDEQGAILEIPAKINDDIQQQVKNLAFQAFQTLECSGLARCDFFLTDDGQLLINEVNSIPGFTQISMYPKLWQAAGISYPQLIRQLIDLAIERYRLENELKTTFD